jgi:hypothetical protein
MRDVTTPPPYHLIISSNLRPAPLSKRDQPTPQAGTTGKFSGTESLSTYLYTLSSRPRKPCENEQVSFGSTGFNDLKTTRFAGIHLEGRPLRGTAGDIGKSAALGLHRHWVGKVEEDKG